MKQGESIKPNPITRGACALASIALTALVLSSFASVSAAETPIPKPDGLKKPVKVFILEGQSNMEGPASIETFGYIGDDPAAAPLLKQMRGADGKPRVCDHVWISYLTGGGDNNGESTR